ncbi:MAG: hypothetical protein SFV15_14550 [Polyangiaceae bacterium]|nr:hypothetical protein [Polyangiaceae bacterium]
MTKFVSEQFSLSTAEHAVNYFTRSLPESAPHAQSFLPPGTYRVIDGALRRVVEGVPPALAEGWHKVSGEPNLAPLK